MNRLLKYKHFLQVIVFLIIVAISFGSVSSVVGHSNEQRNWIHEFRARDALQVKANSLDIVAIGASPNISGFSPMELYEKYGVTSFSAGVGFGSDFCSYYLLLQEMLKTQSPSILLIEMHCIFYSERITGTRVVSDEIPFSIEKYEALNELSDEYLNDSRLSYVFPIMKFHERYKSITKDDFFKLAKSDYYDYFFGFKALHGKLQATEKTYPMVEKDGTVTMNQFQLYYLEKILDLCEEKNIIPILYRMPINSFSWTTAHSNTVKEFAEKRSLTFIDLNTDEAARTMNFSLDQDFNDAAHVNFYGAVKVSRYLADYLHENYDLPDHRGDPAYAYWDEELERYHREQHNNDFLYTQDLSSYLEVLQRSSDGYTMIISAKDDAATSLDTNLQTQLKEMGFQSDFSVENFYRKSFIGIWQDGKVIYEQMSEGNDLADRDVLEYDGVLPDGLKYYVQSAGCNVGNKSSIVIDGTQYSKNSRGLNLVVYDNVQQRVVDTIVFDTFKDAGITYNR